MFSDEKYKININFNDGSIIAAKVNNSVFFISILLLLFTLILRA